MGYSYKDWAGVFYPAGVATRDYLTNYSRVFNSVEIDSTFYGTPKLAVVQRWAASVPAEFRFSAKTPRLITHDLSLAGTAGLMEEFVSTITALQEKLGVILLQFPPSFQVDRFPVLEAFLSGLPHGPRYAVELRHASWHKAAVEVAAMLSGYTICWAATQYPRLPMRIYRTTDFIYLRLIGQHGAFHYHDHERIDRTVELKHWLGLLQNELQHVSAIYAFFNNDYAGFAAATANRFKEIAGLPVEPLIPPDVAVQKRMF